MKHILRLLMILSLGSVAAPAEVLVTNRISTPPRWEAVPADLSFQSTHALALDTNWFQSLFPQSCGETLAPQPFSIRAIGPDRLEIYMGETRLFAGARAVFVPVHYAGDEAVHPYFLLKIPGWVALHFTIHRSGPHKTLKLSVVQVVRGEPRLKPVLEAFGR